jgi:hypothetical protein
MPIRAIRPSDLRVANDLLHQLGYDIEPREQGREADNHRCGPSVGKKLIDQRLVAIVDPAVMELAVFDRVDEHTIKLRS